jgi:phosphatidylserine/phosphatidylglycerophosphate/cardiolipin synthase-like enzyme
MKGTGFFLAAALCLVVALPAQAAPAPATGTVETAFTPWDDAEGLLIRTLRGARRSIHVQAYLLTSRNIAAALQSAHERGVEVRLLADRDGVEKGSTSLVPQLAAAGIPVRLETRYAVAHNKVVVIDAEAEHSAVVTGSYNFTWSAQAKNAENLLVLRDDPALTRAYYANWQRHWEEATPFDGAATAAESAPRKSKSSRDGVNPCALLPADVRRLLSAECHRH